MLWTPKKKKKAFLTDDAVAKIGEAIHKAAESIQNMGTAFGKANQKLTKADVRELKIQGEKVRMRELMDKSPRTVSEETELECLILSYTTPEEKTPEDQLVKVTGKHRYKNQMTKEELRLEKKYPTKDIDFEEFEDETDT